MLTKDFGRAPHQSLAGPLTRLKFESQAILRKGLPSLPSSVLQATLALQHTPHNLRPCLVSPFSVKFLRTRTYFCIYWFFYICMCVYIFMCVSMCHVCVCICVCAHVCGYLSWVRMCTWKAEMDFGISN